MSSALARSSALLASLLALIPPRSAAHLVHPVPAGTGALPQRARATPVIPYPDSLDLLDVLDGARPAPLDPVRGPGSAQGERAIPYPEGLELLDGVLTAGDMAVSLLTEMSRACSRVARPYTSPAERVRQQAIYRHAFETLARLADACAIDAGWIDGSRDVWLARPPRGSDVLFVDLPDWSVSTLGLPGALLDMLHAQFTADLVWETCMRAKHEQARLSIARQELVEGTPNGGLREIERLLARMRGLAEQASLGSLNTTDRNPLDAFVRSDLERIDAVARSARFDDVALLAGGEIELEGRLGNTLVLDLPSRDASGLGLSDTDLTVLTNAMAACVHLDEALASVRTQRKALADTRANLAGVVLHVR